MRNSFRSKENHGFGAEAEGGQASSPDQLAVVWSGERDVVAAAPMPGNTPDSYDLDLTRFPAGFNSAAAIKTQRANHPNLPPLSEQTLYSTVVSDFSERTRILALNGEILALDDEELIEWLLDAEKQMYLGTDNHPVFETALDDTACSISRLPNGQVTMTEVPRQHIPAIREKIHSLIGENASGFINLIIETPIRCAARYFLTALPEGADTLRDEKESEVTVFLLIGKSGFSYGLWSPATGLFSEYAFPAPKEINFSPRSPAESSDIYSSETVIGGGKFESRTETPSDTASGEFELPRDERLEKYIRDAFDQLHLQLSPEKLEQLELSNYAQIVWAAEAGLSAVTASIAAEYAATTGLEFFQLPVPSDEAVAGGLLFGSFTFGDETAAGAEIMPPVNLARDILVLADKEEIERRRIEEINILKRRNRAVFSLLAAPVIVLAALLALTADLVRTQIMTGVRELSADDETLRLKPALDRRKSYETNLKWYQEFITQVSNLRRQQPVGIGMLYELDSSYPFNTDPSFYMANLQLGSGSGSGGTKCFDCVEIKGLARNKDAVTLFLKSLEFTGGPKNGTKLFNNLTYEVVESTPPSVVPADSQAKIPAITGSGLTGSSAAPGIVAWAVKGNYTPLTEFNPPPDKNAKPAAETPAATPKPAS